MSDSIEYRGKKVRLSKAYSDYDDYKGDPENILPSDTASVQQMVGGATLAATYATWDELFQAVWALKFPGYAGGRFMTAPQPDGTELFGFLIEIPRSGKNRYIVYRSRNETFERADDFQAPDSPMILRVEERDGQFIYSTVDGKVVVSRVPNGGAAAT
jgi:hypothetical protein